jgi:hypothetical protein
MTSLLDVSRLKQQSLSRRKRRPLHVNQTGGR